MKSLQFILKYPFAAWKVKPHMALCFAQQHDIDAFNNANKNLPKDKQIDITYF